MGKKVYNDRVNKFLKYIEVNHQLPFVGTSYFEDGTDMRLWFNSLISLKGVASFVDNVFEAVKNNNIVLLSDKEKENEFLEHIGNCKHVPYYHEVTFSDGSDMYTWYMSYRLNNRKFERCVCNELPEFYEFDINTILDEDLWKAVRNFLRCDDKCNKTYRDIDMITIVYKLIAEEPKRFEEELLAAKMSTGSMESKSREGQFIEMVSSLGYIPYLQEARFPDFVDMYTWYNNIGALDNAFVERVNTLLARDNEQKMFNIYFFPGDKNTYTLCRSEEDLPISDGTSIEDALRGNPSLKRAGIILLPRDGKIRSLKLIGEKKDN